MANVAPIEETKEADASTNKINVQNEHKGEMALRLLSLVCVKDKLISSALTFELQPRGDLIDASSRR